MPVESVDNVRTELHRRLERAAAESASPLKPVPRSELGAGLSRFFSALFTSFWRRQDRDTPHTKLPNQEPPQHR
jgi:hypothetical protein